MTALSEAADMTTTDRPEATRATTGSRAGRTPKGWPFFAPSQEDAITAALDLADVRPGERFVDLGCGEGHVLVEAARRGARVLGIECNAALVETAREALAEAGLPDAGDVIVGDIFDPSAYQHRTGDAGDGDGPRDPATPDVLFSYLSPASLQRLTPVLSSWPGARLVTVDFDVPDLEPDDTRGPARLYRLPGRTRQLAADPGSLGWPSAGTLCLMPPGVNSLTSFELVHKGGPVSATLRGGIARHAALAVGADRAEPGQPVAIDIRWRERGEPTLAQGLIEVEGHRPHPVTVLFAEQDQGQWDLSPDGCADLDTRLRRRSLPRPTTAKELLDALGV